ncbi:MAG TPA: Ku protein [Pirellulaceae bacterium]|nr:Ku protein [Pirellulaceae bacterium]
MAAHAAWKGYLKLSLVSVPVRAYSATNAAAAIRLNQLHEACHSRIKYQKTCPIHGEVAKEEIVLGYEYAKGQYVEIDPAEIKALRTTSEDAISVDAIVHADAIDPLHFTEKSYYLLPDGNVAQKPYALIQRCLADDDLQAVARVVLFGRDELVVVRPIDGLLTTTALKYEAEIRQTSMFSSELEPTPHLAAEEVSLTKTLLKSFLRREFSLAAYKDEYIEKLTSLIEAKVEGKKLVSPPPTEEPRVINLVDALKKSLARAGTRGGPAERTPAPRRTPGKVRKSKSAARARRQTG